MRLMGMRFRDFTWKDNPVDLQVKAARRVAETKIPYGQTQVEEVGQERRKVSGKGYFAGADCMERWNDLQQVFSQGGPGLLQLPGLSPFWAVMRFRQGSGALWLFLYGVDSPGNLCRNWRPLGPGRGEPVGLWGALEQAGGGTGGLQPPHFRH